MVRLTFHGCSSSSMAMPSYSTPSSQYGSGSGSGYGSGSGSGYGSGSGSGYGSGSGSGYGGDSSSSSSAAMPTYTPPSSYPPSQYGSGSSSWNNGGYDNCVQRRFSSICPRRHGLIRPMGRMCGSVWLALYHVHASTSVDDC